MKGQNSTKYSGLFECYPVTNRYPIVSWRLAEGYPLTLSANILRTFRKLSILMFWERYLLTLSGLSANVLLTLFCWVGTNVNNSIFSDSLSYGKQATLAFKSNSIPRKVIAVAGLVVLSGAIGTPNSPQTNNSSHRWQCWKLPQVRQSKADNFWMRTENFCWFFFNFMFMIWDSSHEDLQLFTEFQTLPDGIHILFHFLQQR